METESLYHDIGHACQGLISLCSFHSSIESFIHLMSTVHPFYVKRSSSFREQKYIGTKINFMTVFYFPVAIDKLFNCSGQMLLDKAIYFPPFLCSSASQDSLPSELCRQREQCYRTEWRQQLRTSPRLKHCIEFPLCDFSSLGARRWEARGSEGDAQSLPRGCSHNSFLIPFLDL